MQLDTANAAIVQQQVRQHRDTGTCDVRRRRCHVDDKKGKLLTVKRDELISMGRPSIEAAAMAGADWAQYQYSLDDDDDEPPEHLRAFEAFLETVVPPDMALAFGRDEAARARARRGRREDVQEKLKLWAKAVGRDASSHGVALGSQSQRRRHQAAASPRLIAHAREPVAILARPPAPGEPAAASSHARGSKEKGGGAQTLPGQARVVGELGVHTKAQLAPSPSPRSVRRGEPCQSNQPLPKQDIKCIYGV